MTAHATTPHQLSSFLARLRSANLHHELRHTREDALLSVDVAIPGERWEIDFLHDGGIDVEIFRSDGTIHGEAKLDDLFRDASA
jgi:hypothetical protein